MSRAHVIPDRVSIETMVEHSFRDYHVKGFDYLCLERSPKRTVKAYFFAGDIGKLPEVVIPHDHRYAFYTHVAAGEVSNITYRRTFDGHPAARLYDEFEYLTPLNGGDGFAWKAETHLREVADTQYEAGEFYNMLPDDLHTIRIAGPETVLVLHQYEDVVPVGLPTSALRPVGSREPPSLSGLYSRMTADEALSRLALLKRLLAVPLVAVHDTENPESRSAA